MPSKTSALRRNVTGWSFSGVYVLFLLVFGLIPVIFAIAESFHPVMQPGQWSLHNYVAAFTDFRFLPAVGNVLTFMIIWIPIMVFGTLLLALLLHERASRSIGALRLIYFLPGAVTGSAAVMLWYFMLSPELSPFAPVFHALGWETNNEMFTTGHLAPIFALVAFATGVGQWILIMFGSLQAIPEDVLEAARIDGAGPIRTAFSVKLPLIGKYVVYMVILSFAGALQIFVEPALFFAITAAGSASWSLNQLSYAFAFGQGDFGMSATVSIFLFVLSVIAASILVFKTNFFQTEVEN
jgi:multiple sugar transport system permease protein